MSDRLKADNRDCVIIDLDTDNMIGVAPSLENAIGFLIKSKLLRSKSVCIEEIESRSQSGNRPLDVFVAENNINKVEKYRIYMLDLDDTYEEI